MQVLVIGIVAYWFAVQSNIPNYIKDVLFNFGVKKKIQGATVDVYTPIRLKPFDCEKCLAFWIGITWFPFTVEGIALACVSSFVSIVIGILINKIK